MSWLSDIPFFGSFLKNTDSWINKWETRAKWGGALLLIIVLIFLAGVEL